MATSDLGIEQELVRDVDIYSEDVRQNWFEHSVEWATSPPFFSISQGAPQFVCGRYADSRRVYHERDTFTTTVPQQPGNERYDWFSGVPALPFVDGAAHDRIRRLMQPTLGSAGVARLEAGVREVVDGILDDISAKGGEFDAVADFSALFMPRILLGRFLGIKEEHWPVFIRMLEASALPSTIAPGEDLPAEYDEAFEAARTVTNEVIAEHQQGEPRQDFVSSLLEARARGEEVSDDEIFANLFVIAAGGLGTTAATASTMLMTLCRHRDELVKLQQNLDLVPSAVEECLRYHPAGMFGFPRFATTDAEVGGVHVPAGTVVWHCTTAGNFDPAQFPDPLRFDIERNPKHILTFGLGTHFCIGAVLARMTLQAALRGVVERFPDLRLVDPDFRPRYGHQIGELSPERIPMSTST